MPVIDAHHHFWRYTAEDYGWIPSDWSRIRRDFLPADLEPEIRAAGVDGVISVQARQSLAETEWLLDLAAAHPFIRGVVGWAPLVADDLSARLDRLCAHPAFPKLRALRHVLQDEPDDAHMLRPDFNRGIRELTRRGLAYDILVLARHLPNTVAFVDRHPEQVFVLDHIAKPPIATGELDPWAANIRKLARRPNVTCKLSGMVTEADTRHWTPEQLRPYFDTALEAFGPSRLLYGSDWPVCLAGAEYSQWEDTAAGFIAPRSATERTAIMGANALALYRLP